MKSKIKTLTEEYFEGTNNSVSVLVNYVEDGRVDGDIISIYFLYYYNNVYIVFDTIFDYINFVFYGNEKNMSRGYIDEEDFDELYDKEFEGVFKDKVEWVNCKK